MAAPRSHLLDVYDCWLHVAVTPKQWRRLADKYDLDRDITSAGHLQLFIDTGANNQPHLAVWIRPGSSGRALVDTIAHEATHAAAQLLDHVGQRAERHDSETLAYLIGWISGWLWEAMP